MEVGQEVGPISMTGPPLCHTSRHTSFHTSGRSTLAPNDRSFSGTRTLTRFHVDRPFPRRRARQVWRDLWNTKLAEFCSFWALSTLSTLKVEKKEKREKRGAAKGIRARTWQRGRVFSGSGIDGRSQLQPVPLLCSGVGRDRTQARPVSPPLSPLSWASWRCRKLDRPLRGYLAPRPIAAVVRRIRGGADAKGLRFTTAPLAGARP